MPRRRTPLLLALIVLLGCSRGASPSRPVDPAVSTTAPSLPLPPAEPSSSAAAAAAKPPTLIVAGEEGLREVRYDGSLVRALSKTPAGRPRIMPGGKDILFYVRASGEIRKLSLSTLHEAVIATLPTAFKTCDKHPDTHLPKGKAFTLAELNVQRDDEFVLDAPQNALCLTLMDRNANMANVQIQAHVDLLSGRVTHGVTIGGGCEKKPAKVPSCPRPEMPASPASAAPFPVASLGVPEETQEELIAPSGRWSVLSHRTEDGDYIHRSLFLLDRQKKLVYRIAEGPFPAKPLDDAERRGLKDLQGTVDAVYESVVRWLDGDALLIDTLLVVPEGRGVDLGGDVAL